jgi:anti-sigma regulatory factor (Ser/Thr protein kinase)
MNPVLAMNSSNKKEINYLNSYKADPSIVPLVINNLIINLKKMQFPKDEIDEIILSMDEAITNAVQESIRKQTDTNNSYVEESHEITIRYYITEDNFDATIIDNGKGLNVNDIICYTPDKASNDYYEQIVMYATDSEKQRLKVRINGKEVLLKGIGAGLKVILAFMDSISIDLIDKEKVVSSSITEFTDGTILTLKRKKRYF